MLNSFNKSNGLAWRNRNKILNKFPMLNSFNKSNGLAWRIIEQNGFKRLFGIMTDSTSDKKCFRLYWFYQCLYVPCPTYDIGCGEDISNGLAWRIIEQNGFKILFGIMTDSTSDKKCFRLYWFYQCLYVPCPT